MIMTAHVCGRLPSPFLFFAIDRFATLASFSMTRYLDDLMSTQLRHRLRLPQRRHLFVPFCPGRYGFSLLQIDPFAGVSFLPFLGLVRLLFFFFFFFFFFFIPYRRRAGCQ